MLDFSQKSPVRHAVERVDINPCSPRIPGSVRHSSVINMPHGRVGMYPVFRCKIPEFPDHIAARGHDLLHFFKILPQHRGVDIVIPGNKSFMAHCSQRGTAHQKYIQPRLFHHFCKCIIHFQQPLLQYLIPGSHPKPP